MAGLLHVAHWENAQWKEAEMTISTKYLGLDVHRDTISIVIADEGRDWEIRFFGTVANAGEVLDSTLLPPKPHPCKVGK